MAQFDASINLNVNSSKAERQVKRLEAAVDKVNRAAAKLDFNNKNLDKAAAAAERLYRSLEKIESAALSKLPTSVQTLIAYLKAANVATARLTANAVGAAVGFKQLSGVNFAPIIRQEKQVRDLLFEIIEAQVRFQNAARNFRPRLSGQNPFQYILDGLDLVQVKVIETERLLKGFGQNLKRLGGAGGAGGGSGGSGGGGGGGSQRALPPGDFGFLGNPNTIRGLQVLRAQLQDLLDTTVIGSRQFRQLEDAIAGVNVRLRDAQLKGQRGGSGVAERGGRRRGSGQGGVGAAIGFPLLFGGGPGSILGGVAGSLIDDFNGAILGSGLGATLDGFTQKTVALASALNGAGGSVEAVEALVGSLDRETANIINNLESTGQLVAASDLAFQELAKTVGEDNAEALTRFGNASKIAFDGFKKLTASLAGTSIQVFSLERALGLLSPTIANLVGLLTGGKGSAIVGALLDPKPKDSTELSNQQAQSAGSLDLARTQAELAEAERDNNEQAVDALARKAALQRKNNELLIIAQKIQSGKLKDSIGENEQRRIELQYRKDIAELDKKSADAAERKAKAEERAAEKARREAEAAERKRQAAFDKARRGRAAILQETQKQVALDTKLIEQERGREAAIREELLALQNNLQIQVSINALTIKDVNLRREKLRVLQLEAELRQNILNLELASLRIQERLTKLQGQRALNDITTNIGRQIEDANKRPTGNIFGDEQADLRIDQLRRELDIRTDLNRRIEDQTARIEELSKAKNKEGQILDPDALQAAKDQRKNLEDQVALYDRLLPQLNAAEQAQLRYNQVLQAATPFAEAFATDLTQGLRDVVAGTKTAEEAFANFLNNIADLLIQTAATMIAQYIAIGIASRFAGLGGTVGDGGTGPLQKSKENFFGNSLEVLNRGYRASGGPIAQQNPYIVGENGSELFIPNVSGRIIPADDFEAARAAMGGGGGSDSSTVDGAFDASSSSVSSVRERLIQNEIQATSSKFTSDPITFETYQIGSMDVVTREEAEAIGQASAQQARAQVFSDMRNRPAVRRQIGVK